ncbi:MATE family efflux transporter [Sulfitobacter geojensis]|uniref:MATE family efflux transporter n=1 Tax=Sulfitobacter geojensis TaxID=1342299 RepID=UPI0004695364|nr:MATE family efflux transporter [Sulfitobacter geojensis]KHA53692.1 Mate efflux pump protein [Sulfitobacter geojensis]NYI27666.1 putative MATE family efflux protein [Sulfitobacter geojensis]
MAEAKFLKGNLFGHVTVMSLTASLGLMAVFIVDFVDMIFISMLGKAELAAAIGYAGAILFFTASIGIGLGIAAGALVARALGSGDEVLARERTTHALGYGFVLGVGFSTLVWLMLDKLVALLGASGETAGLAVHFLQIIVPSMPFLILGMMGSAVLRAHGDARRAMMATIAGGVVNAVLDPILIFGLDLELTGAAIASVAARLTICFMAIWPLVKIYQGIVRPKFRGMLRDLGPVLAIAFPTILAQVATPVGQAFVTRAISGYGEEAVAGMAIVARLVPVAFGVVFALSGAVGPIIGQNYGAGDMVRVKRGFNAGILFVALIIVFVSAILFFARGAIADLFGATGVTRDLIYLFCGPLSLAFFFPGVLFVSNAAFNNLGQPFLSTFTNWGRNAVALIPLVFIGSWLGGAQGVLIGQALAGVIFGTVAWVLALRVIDRGGAPVKVKQDLFGREGRLMTLFHARR